MRRIRACRVLVADVTGNNFSVGYELGFAHTNGKPTVAIVKSGSAIPYDVRALRAVEYDYTNRASLRRAIPQLVEQLRRLRMGPPTLMDNPIKNALRIVVEPPPPSRPVETPPVVLSPPDLASAISRRASTTASDAVRAAKRGIQPGVHSVRKLLCGRWVMPPRPQRRSHLRVRAHLGRESDR
jgi:hypothetical protein